MLTVWALWALVIGVGGAAVFFDGLVNPDPEVGAIWGLVMAVIGFFPLAIQAADVWQHRKLATESDREERLLEWESKKANIFDLLRLLGGALVFAGLIWVVTSQIKENEDSIDGFFEERRAANCKDLIEKVIVYDKCEQSRGCTLSLEEFQERGELISEIGQECQNP